jgi:MerR family copper efflux transcriptional regulator
LNVGRSLPIACSLSDEDRRARLREFSSLSSRVLGAESTGGGGSLIRFRPDGDTQSQLRRIMAAERECCPFLDLSLTENESDLTLSIEAPEDAKPMIAEIVDTLTGA